MVFGYLVTRCGDQTLAEDLTAETFLAAVDAVRRPVPADVTVAWLVGVARHKLADHWRGTGREHARLERATVDPTSPSARTSDDPWDAQIDRLTAGVVLEQLAPQHRLALTLRYVDDLSVTEVAELLGKSLHATEGLLVRARQSFRRRYCTIEPQEGASR